MAKTKLELMAAMLERYGDRFTGGNAEEMAQDWIDHAFTVADADDWCDIGVWDASTAAALRDADLTPERVRANSRALTEGLDGEQARERYTDGDPIYSVCNGDTWVDVLLSRPAAHELVVAGWLGTPDQCAPEGYSLFGYFDDAWKRLGFAGDCPNTFSDESLARKVCGAIREDQHGVMPRVEVRPVWG